MTLAADYCIYCCHALVLPSAGSAADRKLLLVVRHGQAVSNYLSDTLGPDEWFNVEGTCQYDDKQGTIYNVFDAGSSFLLRQSVPVGIS